MTSTEGWVQQPITIAEHSYFWLGVERLETPDGTVTTGEQMYVEYMIPAELRRPNPIVLIHGGGGQGLGFMGPGGGKPGWVHYLLQEGFAVYLVDRPGHGRTPYIPERLGPSVGPVAYEPIVVMVRVGAAGGRWPGTGEIGDPGVDQFMAQQGPMPADNARAHALWRERGVELLERIGGPAVLLTHSSGGPFGWVVGDARPDLVRAIVCVEGLGPMQTDIPLTYEPPISSLADLSLVDMPDAPEFPAGATSPPRLLVQAEPPRRLVNLSSVPIMVLTSEDPRFRALDFATVAYLRQAGCTVDDLRLADLGIHGNGHFMPLETNNRQVLQVVLDWLAALPG